MGCVPALGGEYRRADRPNLLGRLTKSPDFIHNSEIRGVHVPELRPEADNTLPSEEKFDSSRQIAGPSESQFAVTSRCVRTHPPKYQRITLLKTALLATLDTIGTSRHANTFVDIFMALE